MPDELIRRESRRTVVFNDGLKSAVHAVDFHLLHACQCLFIHDSYLILMPNMIDPGCLCAWVMGLCLPADVVTYPGRAPGCCVCDCSCNVHAPGPGHRPGQSVRGLTFC